MWWMRTELSRWILLLSCLLTSSRTPSLRNTSKRPSSPTIDERKVDLELGDPFDSDDEKTRCLKQRHQTERVLTVRMTPIYLQHIRMARLNALMQHHLSNNQGRWKPVVNTDAKGGWYVCKSRNRKASKGSRPSFKWPPFFPSDPCLDRTRCR